MLHYNKAEWVSLSRVRLLVQAFAVQHLATYTAIWCTDEKASTLENVKFSFLFLQAPSLSLTHCHSNILTNLWLPLLQHFHSLKFESQVCCSISRFLEWCSKISIRRVWSNRTSLMSLSITQIFHDLRALNAWNIKTCSKFHKIFPLFFSLFSAFWKIHYRSELFLSRKRMCSRACSQNCASFIASVDGRTVILFFSFIF